MTKIKESIAKQKTHLSACNARNITLHQDIKEMEQKTNNMRDLISMKKKLLLPKPTYERRRTIFVSDARPSASLLLSSKEDRQKKMHDTIARLAAIK